MNERPKTGSGKKFSISIQVPDDMAAQWPDRSTAERLIEEIFRAMSGASPALPPARRIRTPVVVLFLAALFGAGVVAGYLGAKAYAVFSLPVDRPGTTATLGTEPSSAPQAVTPPAAPIAQQPAADLSSSTTSAVAAQPAPAAPSPEAPVRTVVAPAVVYHVQIGAFRLRENADTLVQLLGRDGFKPSVLESGKLFIVYLGTFTDQKDAARLANALRTRHYEVVVIAAPAQAAQH